MADRSFLVADAARLLGSEPSNRSTIAFAQPTLRTPRTLHNSAFRSGRADRLLTVVRAPSQEYTRTQSTYILPGKGVWALGPPGQTPPTAKFTTM
jgi:hypothetical protein